MPPFRYTPWMLDNYTPVLRAMPALEITDVMEAPLVCVTFSAALVPYLLGLLEIYRWPDKFSGTPQQIAASLGIVQDLMAILMEGNCVSTGFDVRWNGCTLQKTLDGGETWLDVGGIEDCVTGIVDGIITDRINDGTLERPGGQPGPSDPPLPGQCQAFHIRLGANSKWLCPFPVNTGDVITILMTRGGWTDGTISWFCPDGNAYLIGACVPDSGIHDPGDPLGAPGNHLQLIGVVDTTPFSPLGASYTIPAGMVDKQLVFQANDATLNDNFGEIEFDVEICTGAWSHTFDFTVDNGGFTNVGGTGQYTPGIGWEGLYYASDSREICTIFRSFTEAHIVSVVMTYDKNAGSGSNNASDINLYNGASTVASSGYATTTGVNLTKTLNIASSLCDKMRLDVNTGSSNGTVVIKRCVISGTGQNPFV